MSNRKKTEAFILDCIEYMLPGGFNKNLYVEKFKEMNDKEFDAFMKRLEDGSEHLVIVAPNLVGTDLSIERNIILAKKLKHNFFERIWIKGMEGMPDHLSPIEYFIVDLPIRRASQVLKKKISIPEHSKTVDKLTGQPTGDSKGAKVSFPELQVLMAMGMEKSSEEFFKYRGGDLGGYRALRTMLSKYGYSQMQALAPYATGPESTKTFKAILTSAHLSTNL